MHWEYTKWVSYQELETKLESSEHRHRSFNLSQEEPFINVCAFLVFLPRFLVYFRGDKKTFRKNAVFS